MKQFRLASVFCVLLVVGAPFVGAVETPPTDLEFDRYSSTVRFYRSKAGQAFLRSHASPPARAILGWLDGDVTATKFELPQREPNQAFNAGSVSASCGTSAGTKFSFEGAVGALPQNEQSIDFLLNRVSGGVDLIVGGSNDFNIPYSFTGYYGNRDSDCAPEFEGGLPLVEDPLELGTPIIGVGDPATAADATRGAFFMADLRLDETTSGIGVFRASANTLLSSNACPNGSHDELDSSSCWPTKVVLYEKPAPTDDSIVDKPHLAVDERSSGTGNGQVYIVATDFTTPTTSSIKLVSCNNTLTTCSDPVVVSGSDSLTQFPHVAIRPSGHISVTWINIIPNSTGSFPVRVDIKYRWCTVQVAPTAPVCQTTTVLKQETRPLSGVGADLVSQDFRILTYPKHEHRSDANGIETYVVWDRCKVDRIFEVICPDSDVVMMASKDNGTSWSGGSINSASQDQFLPWLDVDRSRNIVNVTYYSSSVDATFQHDVRIGITHIDPGGATPDPAVNTRAMTTLPNDLSGDALFRRAIGGLDYIGVAARGTGSDGASRAYVHFTYNNGQATLNSVNVPNQNNHLARLNY